MPDAHCSRTEALPDGLTTVVRAAWLIPISAAVTLFQCLTVSAPLRWLSMLNRVSGLFIQPVMPTPMRASRSTISRVAESK